MKHLNKMLRLFLVFLILACFACEKDSSNDDALNSLQFPADYIGIWEGDGHQSGASWTIKITFSDSEYSIEYPSIPCDGTLTLIEGSENQVLLREKINSGSLCGDNGLVELTPVSEDKLTYKYYHASTGDERGQLGATGEVVRK